MNALKNKVSLIGRLGANPEVLTFDSGKTLARFTLATNESFKSNNEWQEVTQWHIITAWGKTAEKIKNILSKGQEIILEGRLVNQSYETKNGEKRYSTQVEMTDFYILKSNAIEKSKLENNNKSSKK
jgi:single-strand DNA-binding protein